MREKIVFEKRGKINFRRTADYSYINPYYGTSAGQTPGATTESDSPTATAALAAYYGNAGFTPTGTASGTTAQAYATASYYYNSMAAAAGYFPGQHSGYTYGTVGGTQRYPAEECKREGPEPVYHLRNVPVPPHIAESGPNSLDDVLKPASKFQNTVFKIVQKVSFLPNFWIWIFPPKIWLLITSSTLEKPTMTWMNLGIFTFSSRFN